MSFSMPIAETFIAPQGEGMFAGTLMLFIRLAGCTVGKPWTAEGKERESKRTDSVPDYTGVGGGPLFHIAPNHEMCTLYDGRTFCCDTDYKKKQTMELYELVGLIDLSEVGHVCITGGEPLIHATLLSELFMQQYKKRVQFHLETSGTVSMDKPDVQRCISNLLVSGGHITTSPKMGYLDEEYSEIVDEAKLLVDEDFSMENIPALLREKGILERVKVYIQPVNGIDEISEQNMHRCLELQQMYRWLRLSIQAHKVWKTR